MRTLILLALAAPAWGQGVLIPIFGGQSTSTKYCQSITIDHTKIGSTDLTNYVLTFTGSANLKTVANGGFVQNASGYDIWFGTGSDYSTGKLPWETVLWSASTGLGQWAVNVGNVSHTVDTVIYNCFGDATKTTDQSNKAGTWVNGSGIYHLADGTTLSLADSGSNGFTLTNSGLTATAGQVDGAAADNGSSSASNASAAMTVTDNFTVSAWLYPTLSGSTNDFKSPVAFGSAANGLSLDTCSNAIRACGGTNGWLINFPGVSFWNPNLSMDINAWQHMVIVRNAGTTTVYKNGVAGGTTSAAAPKTATANTIIGVGPGGAEGNFTGNIDEVKFLTTPWSASYITATYNNELNPATFYAQGAKVNVP